MSVIGSMQRQATGQISARNQAGANGISVRYLFPLPGAMVLQGLHYPGYVPMKSSKTSNAKLRQWLLYTRHINWLKQPFIPGSEIIRFATAWLEMPKHFLKAARC